MSKVTFDLTLQQLNALTEFPVEALDAVAADGETVLLHGGTYRRTQTMPKLKGGWRLQLITRPRKTGEAADAECEGKVVLFFGDDRTKEIWLSGQKAFAMREGLKDEHAEIWVRSKVPYKHDALKALAAVMRKPKLVEAYLRYPGGRDHKKVEEWVKEFNIFDNHSPRKRDNLSSLVAEMVHGIQEPEPQNQIMSKALQAALAKAQASKADAEAAGKAVIEEHAHVEDAELDSTINGNTIDDVVEVAQESADEVVAEAVAADQPPQQ